MHDGTHCAAPSRRFEAGITDNIEVVQAQESLAAAELDYINRLFAHNVGKLSLARALGQAAERCPTSSVPMTRQTHFGWHSDDGRLCVTQPGRARVLVDLRLT